tara:strand:+ start:8193 stop:10049 length:1857 start_codon:yes stop_codon:yes gene_type:complete
MADSYYDKWLAKRNKRNAEASMKAQAGIPVENMNISGMNNALDGLYAQIMDYKKSDDYKDKLALAEERKLIKKGLREDGMSRKEARRKYKADADAFGEEVGAEGNRYQKRKEYLIKTKADREAAQEIKKAEEKPKEEKESANKYISPLNYGRADATLIAGARRMGEAGRQSDPFAEATSIIDRALLFKKSQRAATRKELDNISLEDIDNGFTGFNGGAEACQGYLSEAKRELASLKAKALKSSPDSVEFQEYKSKMTSIENRWKKLNTAMSSLQTEKGGWVEMNGKGVKNDPNSESDGRFRYSNGTLIEGNTSFDYMNQIMNKSATMIINNKGDIEFDVATTDASGQPTGETALVTLESLQDNIFERDESGMGAFTKYKESVSDNQKNNLQFDQGAAESLSNQLFGSNLGEPNKRTMVSWMYDDLDGDGKTFLEDWGSMLNVDLDQFKSTASWDKKYMVPSEDGGMVETDQTVGEFLRDELKQYYVERLRGFHNNLVEANGKSVRSRMGTGEPIKANGEDFEDWSSGASDNIENTTYQRNANTQNKTRIKNNELFLEEFDKATKAGSKIKAPSGGFFKLQGDGTYVFYKNGKPLIDADDNVMVFSKDDARSIGQNKYE